LYNPHLTVLEPAVGDGRFLTYILHQRLTQSQDVYHTLQAVTTLYGIDSQKNNVIKTREELFNVIKSKNPSILQLPKMKDVLQLIISENIIHGCSVSKKYIDTQQPITINKYDIIELNPILIEITVYRLADVVSYRHDNLLFGNPLPMKKHIIS
jgi:hypothetical protein